MSCSPQASDVYALRSILHGAAKFHRMYPATLCRRPVAHYWFWIDIGLNRATRHSGSTSSRLLDSPGGDLIAVLPRAQSVISYIHDRPLRVSSGHNHQDLAEGIWPWCMYVGASSVAQDAGA